MPRIRLIAILLLLGGGVFGLLGACMPFTLCSICATLDDSFLPILRIPAIGVAIGTSCFAAAWILSLRG